MAQEHAYDSPIHDGTEDMRCEGYRCPLCGRDAETCTCFDKPQVDQQMEQFGRALGWLR